MRTTWLGLGWEARPRSRGDPCCGARCLRAAFPEWNYLRGTQHPITDPISGLGKKRKDSLPQFPRLLPPCPGLGSGRCGHPTRAPGRNLGKNKEQNSVQLCRKPPGMAVPPQHRVVQSMELPQSSAEAWFSLGSNAGVGGAEKLPSLVSEIQYMK